MVREKGQRVFADIESLKIIARSSGQLYYHTAYKLIDAIGQKGELYINASSKTIFEATSCEEELFLYKDCVTKPCGNIRDIIGNDVYADDIFIVHDIDSSETDLLRKEQGLFIFSDSEGDIEILDEICQDWVHFDINPQGEVKSWTDVMKDEGNEIMMPANSALMLDPYLVKTKKNYSERHQNFYEIVRNLKTCSQKEFHFTYITDLIEEDRSGTMLNDLHKALGENVRITIVCADIEKYRNEDVKVFCVEQNNYPNQILLGENRYLIASTCDNRCADEGEKITDILHDRSIYTNNHMMCSGKGFYAFKIIENKKTTEKKTVVDQSVYGHFQSTLEIKTRASKSMKMAIYRKLNKIHAICIDIMRNSEHGYILSINNKGEIYRPSDISEIVDFNRLFANNDKPQPSQYARTTKDVKEDVEASLEMIISVDSTFGGYSLIANIDNTTQSRDKHDNYKKNKYLERISNGKNRKNRKKLKG